MCRILLFFMISLGSISIHADSIDDAVANRHRPTADSKRDSLRKPAEVLRFFGIEEGMAVFDIFAGGGYYSELLSYVVGATGSVTMYNNKPWDDFAGTEVRTRLANDRLPNIHLTVAKPESLVDRMERFDVAIFVLGMHDIYYAHPEDGWPAIDRQVFLRGIFSLVKDGGVLGIVDHDAIAGSDPAEISKSLHRIDPAVVIKDLEAVGFKLESRSEILKVVSDDLTTSAIRAEMRGLTARSVLKFRKPESVTD